MSIASIQAEHDAHTLRTIVDDLAADWRTSEGRAAILDNAHLIENAFDDLVLLVEQIRSQSSKVVVDLRSLEVM